MSSFERMLSEGRMKRKKKQIKKGSRSGRKRGFQTQIPVVKKLKMTLRSKWSGLR